MDTSFARAVYQYIMFNTLLPVIICYVINDASNYIIQLHCSHCYYVLIDGYFVSVKELVILVLCSINDASDIVIVILRDGYFVSINDASDISNCSINDSSHMLSCNNDDSDTYIP